MAGVKTDLVSSPSSPLCNVYPNQQKTSAFFVRRSCRLKGLHRKVNFQPLKLQPATLFNSDFYGKRVLIKENQGFSGKPSSRIPIKAQIGLKLKNALKWWEKGLQPNMKEVTSAQDLVNSLVSAGDKLVVVDFFSPGCGGCKALHPKICQMAEMNPEVQFLQVNYEEHKSMCYSLNVHVLPFFRLYRGAQGRVCSFSCTNATIKKFKDALAKHTPERCSLGPTKGLEEKELAALAANKDLNFTIQPISPPLEEEKLPTNLPSPSNPSPLPLPIPIKTAQSSEDKTLITTGR